VKKVGVYYHSLTGNTRKVAFAMANTLGCEAKAVESGTPQERLEILFIGGAVYATHDHGLAPPLKHFIDTLEAPSVGKVVLFCTGFRKNAMALMKRQLSAKGIAVMEDAYFCKGQLFSIFNRGHPNVQDLDAATDFARTVMEKRP